MTYEEAYRKIKKPETLINEVKKDISMALFLNPDRIKIIEQSLNIIVKEKKWQKYFEKL